MRHRQEAIWITSRVQAKRSYDLAPYGHSCAPILDLLIVIVPYQLGIFYDSKLLSRMVTKKNKEIKKNPRIFDHNFIHSIYFHWDQLKPLELLSCLAALQDVTSLQLQWNWMSVSGTNFCQWERAWGPTGKSANVNCSMSYQNDPLAAVLNWDMRMRWLLDPPELWWCSGSAFQLP